MAADEIKIKVSTELNSALAKTQNLHNQIADQKGYSGKKGVEARTKVEGLLTEMSRLQAQEKISANDLAQLNKLYKEVYSILNTYSSKIANLSKEAEKLQAKWQKLNEKRDAKGQEIRTARSKTNDTRTKMYEAMSGKEFHKLTKEGTLAGGKALTADKVAEILASGGQVGYKDTKTGKEETTKIPKEVQEAAKAFTEAQQAQQKLKVELDNLTVSVEKARTAFEDQVKKDEQNGVSGSSQLVSDVAQSQSDTQTALDTANKQIEDAEEVRDTTDATNQYNQSLQKQNSSLGQAFKQFSIYTIAVRAAKKALREAVKTVKDLDKYLTEQAMVTGKTRQQTYALLGSYQALAKQLGATTKEVAEVATQYMRQGKTTKDALTLTEAAMSAAKVAGISATESVNYLTTALNGFQLAASDAMSVSDKFASIAAQSATSYEEIATALSKVASQANLAGMSIDYTTALLAKGIETTREAPETIGTALKTVIARMRELTDYGETLNGDTDVNNVETQLAYVGIALKDANGELRSTEDVLDELGNKWDTLNTNQQAAIAKALAGTRQQSRLIAMMSDYERVVELQQIAERSAGATASQMNTYLEGMDAALKRVNTAWEQIVSNIVDNELIIGIVNMVGDVLNGIGSIFENTQLLIPLLATIGLLGMTSLTNKIRESAIAKEQNKIELDKHLIELKQQKTKIQQALIEDKITLTQKEQNVAVAKKLRMDTQDALLKAKESNNQQEIVKLEADLVAAKQLEQEANQELEAARIKYREDQVEEQRVNQEIFETQTGQLANMGILGKLLAGILSTLMLINTVSKTIAIVGQVIVKLKDKEYRQELKLKAAKMINALWEGVKAAFQIPIVGFALGAVMLAAVGFAIAGIAGAFNKGKKQNKKDQNTQEDIDKLADSIYKLNQKSTAIDTAIRKFDALDNVIIKTNKDIESMQEALDQAADKLDDDQRKTYDDLAGDIIAQKKYLEDLKKEMDQQADENRRKLLSDIATNPDKFLKDATNVAQVRAINNKWLYDLNTDQNTEKLTQAILSNMDAETAFAYAQDKSRIEDIVRLLEKNDMSDTIGILQDDNAKVEDRLKALGELRDLLKENAVAQAAFDKEYAYFQELEKIQQNRPNAIKFIDEYNLSNEQLNKLFTAYEGINKSFKQAGIDAKITQDIWQENYGELLSILEQTGGDITQAINILYGDLLASISDPEKQQEAAKAMVSAWTNIIEKGLLNLGQETTKFQNTINSFYETASKWNQMSIQEQTQFISENAAIFEAGGEELLKAFESGNWSVIEQALSHNEALHNQLQTLRTNLQRELDAERAKLAKGEGNEAIVASLERQLKALDNAWQASLELRLEQEQKELDAYKDMLQKKADLETKALEKRKDAYSKYFEDINKMESEQDFEEKAAILAANISKLSTSTDGNTAKQRKDLEKELKQLQDDRIKELRQQAQDQIISNIEDEVNQINNHLEDIVESSQALLNYMRAQSGDSSDFLASMISTKMASEGLTAYGLESYLQELRNNYSNLLPNVNWDDITVSESNGNVVLNVSGQEIVLSQDNQQDLYKTIMNALTQLGIR